METGSLSLLTWTFLVTPLLFVLYKLAAFIADVRRRGNAMKGLPSPTQYHWFLGHLVFDETKERSEDLLSVIRSWNRLFSSGLNQFWLTIFEPAVYVRHPDVAKVILKSSEPKPRTYKMGEPWLGDGLLLSSGNKWARNRRLLTPAFHFDVLKPYQDVYNDACDILLRKMERHAENEKPFDLYGNSSLFTMDVILRCAMSFESDPQTKGESHPYVKAVINLGELWNQRIFNMHPIFQLDFFFNLSKKGKDFKADCDFVHEVSNEIINKRGATLKEKGEKVFMANRKYLDFLDILLTAKDEDGVGLSHEDIQAEVDTFLFEGHDTTASALAWTFYMLAKHPEHQRKCQEEVDRILDGRDEDYIEWDDFGKLKYTTMCLKESMRLNTTVPWIQRVLTKSLEMGGHKLAKGTLIQMDLYALHNHQDVWECPEEYKPERFLDTSKKDPFAYVPFSAGPRNCIGQNFALHELKVALARVLRRFNLEPDTRTKPRRQINLVMRAIGGLPVKLTPRQL